jgi:hypothetical protein
LVKIHDTPRFALAAALLLGGVTAAEELKSGPQPGHVLTPFNPLNVTGPDAGKRVGLVEKNGANPVALIFAREVSGPLTRLIKAIDDATGKNSDRRMASFVVFCTDDEGLDRKLKELADKEKLKHTILTTSERAGPPLYKIARGADVTVILYSRHSVKVNMAFKKGERTEADVEKVITELAKILPEKEGKALGP